MSTEDPDAELLAQVGRREPDAVRRMVQAKLPRLLSLATRMLGDRAEAEDVAQETFLRVWKHAGRWQFGAARFDTWLHRVVLNLCYDRLRQRGRHGSAVPTEPGVMQTGAVQVGAAQKDQAEVEQLPDPAPRPDERLEHRQHESRVSAALAQLPPRQREALVLTYYQEYSNLDAAKLLGVSVDALESLLSRARRNLRAALTPGSS